MIPYSRVQETDTKLHLRPEGWWAEIFGSIAKLSGRIAQYDPAM